VTAKKKGTAMARNRKARESAFVVLEAKRNRFATPTVPQEIDANTISEKSRRKLCWENIFLSLPH
jgi:hypothetical protein